MIKGVAHPREEGPVTETYMKGEQAQRTELGRKKTPKGVAPGDWSKLSKLAYLFSIKDIAGKDMVYPEHPEKRE